MTCRKCKRETPPDAVFCPWCGCKLQLKNKPRTRPNGAGSAYRRGKTWTAIVSVGALQKNGKRTQKRKTKSGFKTKSEALEYCKVLKGEPSKTKHADISFADLYTMFLYRHVDRVGKSTMDCYRAAYKYFDAVHLKRFADITTPDLQACVDACPHGKRTKENMKALGTLMYKLAREMDVTAKDYAQFIWIAPADKVSYNPFKPEHEAVLLQAALDGDFGASVIISDCYLGFRPAALLQIKKTDYSPDERVIHGGVKTDAGRDRSVPVSKKIQPIVDRLYASEHEYLFSNREEPLKINYYRDYIFYPTLDRLGIQPSPKYYMPYSCRHTFATKLKSINGATVDIAALMGHTSYEQSMQYQHEDLTSKRAIIGQL